jgi:hypothetical protein
MIRYLKTSKNLITLLKTSKTKEIIMKWKLKDLKVDQNLNLNEVN